MRNAVALRRGPGFFHRAARDRGCPASLGERETRHQPAIAMPAKTHNAVTQHAFSIHGWPAHVEVVESSVLSCRNTLTETDNWPGLCQNGGAMNTSRRDFLASAAAGLAAASARGGLAQESGRSSNTPLGANDTIVAALLGAGRQGTYDMLDHLRQGKVEIA